MAKKDSVIQCSFCGRPPAKVKKLISGPPGVYICDSCIHVCKEILHKALAEDAGIKGVIDGEDKKMGTQELRERLALLRELRDDKAISDEDYQNRVKQLSSHI